MGAAQGCGSECRMCRTRPDPFEDGEAESRADASLAWGGEGLHGRQFLSDPFCRRSSAPCLADAGYVAAVAGAFASDDPRHRHRLDPRHFASQSYAEAATRRSTARKDSHKSDAESTSPTLPQRSRSNFMLHRVSASGAASVRFHSGEPNTSGTGTSSLTMHRKRQSAPPAETAPAGWGAEPAEDMDAHASQSCSDRSGFAVQASVWEADDDAPHDQHIAAPSREASRARLSLGADPQAPDGGAQGPLADDGAESEPEPEEPVWLLRTLERRPSMSLQVMIENSHCIHSSYTLTDNELGKGSYGSVRKATVRATGAARAVKTVLKSRVKDKEMILKQEIEILKLVDHPNIVKLYELFEDEEAMYMVFELCSGGSLKDHVNRWGPLKETYCVRIMTQMMQAISYLHSRCICHRDIKPANALFVQGGAMEAASLRVSDFGLSCMFRPGQVLKARVGTAAFMAPQVLAKLYDEKCDVWSAGVLMYTIICGYTPFRAKTDDEVRKRVAAGTFSFNSTDWLEISEAAMRLVKSMMAMEVTKRPSAMEALQDEWFSQHRRSASEVVSFEPNLIRNLRGFRSLNKFKRAALQVIVSLLNEDQVGQSREAFTWLDENGDGSLSINEVKSKMAELLEGDADVEAIFSRGGDPKLDAEMPEFSYTEFLAATFDRKSYCQKQVCWAAFNILDMNGDGRITKSELCDGQVLGWLTPEESAALVQAFDRDGDGAVDFSEFLHMMQDEEGWTATARRRRKAGLRKGLSMESLPSVTTLNPHPSPCPSPLASPGGWRRQPQPGGGPVGASANARAAGSRPSRTSLMRGLLPRAKP